MKLILFENQIRIFLHYFLKFRKMIGPQKLVLKSSKSIFIENSSSLIKKNDTDTSSPHSALLYSFKSPSKTSIKHSNSIYQKNKLTLKMNISSQTESMTEEKKYEILSKKPDLNNERDFNVSTFFLLFFKNKI